MNEFKEAVIVLAKCAHEHKTYGMRVEKNGKDNWNVTWAFPIRDSSAKREGYDKTSVKGNIQFSGEYPGCPYCGKTQLTLCSCGHLGCTNINNGIYTCEWCGSQGELLSYSGESIIAGMDF